MSLTQALIETAKYVGTKFNSIEKRLSKLEGTTVPTTNYVVDPSVVVTNGMYRIDVDQSIVEVANQNKSLNISALIKVKNNNNTRYSGSNRAGVQIQVSYTDGSKEWLQTFTADNNYTGILLTSLNFNHGKTIQSLGQLILLANLSNAESVEVSRPELFV